MSGTDWRSEKQDRGGRSDRLARPHRVVSRLRRGHDESEAPALDEVEPAVTSPHWLPPARHLELPGRGTTYIHEMAGPTPALGAPDDSVPTLFLLHGWTATGALNWFPSFAALGERYRVVAIDHRGHGRGIHTWKRFRLEDCADDVVAVADKLGIETFIPVGYSMGGPIAQLTWQRHPERVDGLVLCATAGGFSGRPGEKALFSVMAGLSVAARLTPGAMRRSVNERMLVGRFEDDDEGRWATDEMRRHDPRMVIEAGQAIGRFSSRPWIGSVDVPTACVITEFDSVVPPHRQRRLASSIAGATEHLVRGDHTVCVMRPQNFLPALLDACESVTARVDRRRRAAG